MALQALHLCCLADECRRVGAGTHGWPSALLGALWQRMGQQLQHAVCASASCKVMLGMLLAAVMQGTCSSCLCST